MIPESFIEELKYASDIEELVSSYVRLSRKGKNSKGLCPFHSEKTPSFTVYPENGSYYCFGCGAGGDVITFVRQVENLEYVEAVRFLAQKAGMRMPEDVQNDKTAMHRARILEINRETARYYHGVLMDEKGGSTLNYLRERGLTPKTVKRFGLGYAPPGWNSLRDHLRSKGFSNEDILAAAVVSRGRNDSIYDQFRDRVMFPIIDLRGGVIGFGGRVVQGGGPKYLNSPDTMVFKKSRNLFALNYAKATQSDTLLLAEGYMDVIALHQAGFDNAVATLGTSLTAEQSRLIAQYAKKVAIAYDSDTAGQAAAKRALSLFQETDVAVSVLEIKGAKDPDEYIKKFGAQRFQGLIDGGKSAVQYEIDKLKERFDLDSPEGRVAFLQQFCKLMAAIGSDLQREVYISQTARELDVGKEGLKTTVESIRKKRFYAEEKKSSHNLRAFAQDKTGKARSKEGELRGEMAQRAVISMLVRHPDYYKELRGKLTPEDFYNEDLRAIYGAVIHRLSENGSLEPIYLAGQLTPSQMSLYSQLSAAGREIQYYRQQADEYMQAILERKKNKTPDEVAQMERAEYQRYITSLTANKK